MSQPFSTPNQIPDAFAHSQSDGDESSNRGKTMRVFPPLSSAPVIAVDLDDVLSQTNHFIANWHNEVYGTNMDISMFYYYYYWKNPFWGTLSETLTKVAAFYAAELIHGALPVPGAREGVQALNDMGYRLIIVTARMQRSRNQSWAWVNQHFPDMFETIVCTDQFNDAMKEGHGVVTNLHKAQVCKELNAKLLIDDALENALSVVNANPPTPVLLFGKYEWNQRLSGPGERTDDMSFEIRSKAEGGREFWLDDDVALPQGLPLWRVENWDGVVGWIQKMKGEII